MASTLPPVRGVTYNFPIALVSQASTHIFKTTPTITVADVWVSKDGGAFVAATAAPVELLTDAAAHTGSLWQNLTAAEMTADLVTVLYHDAAGAEWQDVQVFIPTVAQTFDTIGAAQVTAQADLDDTAQYKADVSGLATSASITALPAAIWTYTTRTLTSFGTLISSIWTWASRTLTQSAAEVAAAVAGPDLAITRGDSYEQQVTGLGDISTRTKLWLTVKRSKNDTDAKAVIQIEETTGLVYLNAAEAETATDASLTVDDAVLGNVTIRLKPALTAVLVPIGTLYYDWQVLEGADIRTIAPAEASVSADVTRAIE